MRFTLFRHFFFAITLLVSATASETTTNNPDTNTNSDDDTEHFDIIVTMKESNSPVLSRMTSRSFPTREERLNTVAQEAQEFASKSQESLLEFLSTEGQSRKTGSGKVVPEVQSLWITNQILISNADAALMKELSGRPDVGKIELNRFLEMEDPVDDSNLEGDSDDGEDGPWGIENMNIPLVWEKGLRGEGILVANMDSGVRHTHEALSSNYIGEGGWFDVGEEKHPEPRDNGGHGTATMSLIAGTTRNIGVAPGAKWLACADVKPPNRATDIRKWLTCGQWLACPGATPKPGAEPGTGQNCSRAPHIINHSWGGSIDGSDIFEKAVLYYHAAGIIPVFSQGNYGPTCASQGYPGGFSYVISVGAIKKGSTVWEKSSRGPPDHDMDLLKPDLVAPGVRVRFANSTSDTAYSGFRSGTSFAAPYVAGIIALMLQKNPNLHYKQIKKILHATAIPTVSTGQVCGGKPDSEYPNFIAGYGRIDANKVIEYMDTMTE